MAQAIRQTTGWAVSLSRIGRDIIALSLGMMTLLTFINVVLRYVFNHAELIWGS